MNLSRIVVVNKREVFSSITEKCMVSATLPLKNLMIRKKDHEIKLLINCSFCINKIFQKYVEQQMPAESMGDYFLKVTMSHILVVILVLYNSILLHCTPKHY